MPLIIGTTILILSILFMVIRIEAQRNNTMERKYSIRPIHEGYLYELAEFDSSEDEDSLYELLRPEYGVTSAITKVKYQALGVFEQDKIVGYCIYAITNKSRLLIKFVTETNSLDRKDDIANAMIYQVKEYSMMGPQKITAIHIPISNIQMIRCFGNNGFRQMSRIKNHFKNPTEDSILMQYQVLPNGRTL